MAKTPSKDAQCSYNFSPKELSTPVKDFSGITKTVHTHVTKIHNLLQDWNRYREKGNTCCRSIIALKLHECNDHYYPFQLGPITENLLEALKSLGNVLEGIGIINSQLNALASLQPTDDPVVFTWSVKRISQEVDKIYNSLLKEYALKQVIVENVAHCRDEKLIEVYISAWELDVYTETGAYLFAEMGLGGNN